MLKRFILGRYHTNGYVIADEDTKEAAVIDPAGDFPILKEFIDKNQLKVKYILLTHGHGDHIGAIPELKEYTNAAVGINKEDEYMVSSAGFNMSMLLAGKIVEIKPDLYLQDGTTLKLGNEDIKIIHSPGHTKGSVGILFDDQLISGDTLFANSIGRTDLEGGSYETIISSIREKFFTLPEHVVVYPGHGEATTIQIEKESNPYCK